MRESARARELYRIALEQERCGKWNTAPAWNRYYAERDKNLGPLRKRIRKLGEPVFLVVGWLLLALILFGG